MWIYNLADYRQIFALTDQDLQKKIIDYPGGISSVNAELYALGLPIVSADPAYALSVKEMREHVQRILQDNPAVTAQWKQSSEKFLADYELGKQQQRYRAEVVDTFELLLCADLPFSAQNCDALCRLAAEVRIFPLPDEKTAVASELGPLMLALQQRNFGVEVRAVKYPQRSHANAMLRIWAKECTVSN